MNEDFKLTEEDFEVLIESLDNWAEAGNDSLMFQHLIGNAITRGNEIAKSEFDKFMKIEDEKRDRSKREKRRKAALLKAKLILLQQKLMNSPSEFSISDLMGEKP